MFLQVCVCSPGGRGYPLGHWSQVLSDERGTPASGPRPFGAGGTPSAVTGPVPGPAGGGPDWGTPSRTWDRTGDDTRGTPFTTQGVPPSPQTGPGQGYPLSTDRTWTGVLPPPDRTWTGVSFPLPRTADDTPRAVWLLRSTRRTFLLW